MKKITNRALALILILALCLSVSACSFSLGGLTEKDISTYVQGVLDKLYLGQVNPEYLALLDGVTEERCLQDYEEGIEAEYEYFAYWFEIETDMVSETFHADAVAFLKDLYQHSNYQVKSATKNSDGNFMVEVVVQPVDVLAQVHNQMEAFSTRWSEEAQAAYAQAGGDDMSDEAYEEFYIQWEENWAQGVLDMCWEALSDVGYQAEQSLVVQVRQDEESGIYQLQQSDFDNLDILILAYSD